MKFKNPRTNEYKGYIYENIKHDSFRLYQALLFKFEYIRKVIEKACHVLEVYPDSEARV